MFDNCKSFPHETGDEVPEGYYEADFPVEGDYALFALKALKDMFGRLFYGHDERVMLVGVEDFGGQKAGTDVREDHGYLFHAGELARPVRYVL